MGNGKVIYIIGSRAVLLIGSLLRLSEKSFGGRRTKVQSATRRAHLINSAAPCRITQDSQCTGRWYVN